MKRTVLSAVILLFILPLASQAQKGQAVKIDDKPNRVRSCDTLFYFGIDCSHVRVSDGDKIPRSAMYSTVYPAAWIAYVEKEMPPFEDVQPALDKRVMYYNQEEITPVSVKVTPSFIIGPTYYFPTDTLNEAVRKYTLAEKSGIGLVLFPENFNKQEEEAMTWVVFFDISNREILWATKVSGKCKHMGYTAHWGSGIVDGFRHFIRKEYKD
jgi:hypothetical protein